MEKERHQSLPVILLLLIVVFALIYALLIRPNLYLFTGGTIYFETKQVGHLDSQQSEQIYHMNGALYLVSTEGLTKIMPSGEQVWNKSYHFEDPLFIAAPPYMAVVGIMDQEAIIFDENGAIVSVLTEGDILTAKLNAMGYLLTIEDAFEANKTTLWDLKGEAVFFDYTIFRDEGFPVALSISQDSEKLLVSSVSAKTHVLQNTIRNINLTPEGSTHANNTLETLVTDENLVSEVYFFDDRHAIVIGDQSMSFYDVDFFMDQINQVDFYAELEQVTYTDNEVILRFGQAFLPEGATYANKICVYNKKGEIKAEIEVPDKVTAIQGDGTAFFVITSSEVMCYEGYKFKWQASFHKEVKGLYQIEGKKYLVVHPYDYEIIEISGQ